MNIEKKDSISDLASKVKALNSLQSEYFSQTVFINDLGNILDNSYNSETQKHDPKGIDELVKVINNQIDAYSRSSDEITTENYYINDIVKGLTIDIQEEVLAKTQKDDQLSKGINKPIAKGTFFIDDYFTGFN